MADQWKLCRIEEVSDNVSYFAPKTYYVDYRVNEFLEIHFPDTKLEKKRKNYYVLIERLLTDGWEPFAYTVENNFSKSWCFRKRVES